MSPYLEYFTQDKLQDIGILLVAITNIIVVLNHKRLSRRVRRLEDH